MATNRGRAFQCLRCSKDKPYINEKLKVISHVYKHHIALQEAPFYCTLCLFRCQKWQQLKQHVKGFAPHIFRVKAIHDRGEVHEEAKHLKKSEKPYQVGEADMCRLETEQSTKIWQERKKKDRGTGDIVLDALQTSDLLSSLQPDGSLLDLMNSDPSSLSLIAVPETFESEQDSRIVETILDLSMPPCEPLDTAPPPTDEHPVEHPEEHPEEHPVPLASEEQPLDLTFKNKRSSASPDVNSKEEDDLSEANFVPDYEEETAVVVSPEEEERILRTTPETMLTVLQTLKSLNDGMTAMQETLFTTNNMLNDIVRRQDRLEEVIKSLRPAAKEESSLSSTNSDVPLQQEPSPQPSERVPDHSEGNRSTSDRHDGKDRQHRIRSEVHVHDRKPYRRQQNGRYRYHHRY